MSVGLKYRQSVAQQVLYEIESLQDYVSIYDHKIVVSIGESYGGTAPRWLSLKNIECYISIDLVGGIHGGIDQNTRNELVEECKEYAKQHNFEYYNIDGDSKDINVINKLKEILNGRLISYLFIDGDHTLQGVTEDLKNYYKLCREDSIIGFHDIRQSLWHEINNAFVHVFWNDLKKYISKYKEWIVNTIEECFISMPQSAPHGYAGIGIIHVNQKELDYYFNKKQFYNSFNNNIPVSVIIGSCGNENNITSNSINNILEYRQCSKIYCNEIIVIVNGCEKSIADNLQEEFKYDIVKIFYTGERKLGFSQAYNNGIYNSSNEHNIILNNDCIIRNNTWLDLLVNPFEEEHNIGIVCAARKKEDRTILGFCFCITKEVLNKIGLLNEGYYPGYFEDNDLTNRINNSGYIIKSYNEISFEDGNNSIYQFPIDHVGMQTLSRSFNQDDLNTIIKENKYKFEYYSNKGITNVNIRYCLIVNSWNEILDFIYNSDIYRDNYTLVCAILLSDEIINYVQIPYYIHIIRPLDYKTINTEGIKNITKIFFGTDDYFIIKDSEIQNERVTWVTKFDQFSAMGILSENIIKNFPKEFDIQIKNVIGPSNTKDSLINYKLDRQPKDSNGVGIFFAYPDSSSCVKDYDLKICYTGTDTKNGIPNFANNCNKNNVIFTPSLLSKRWMIEMGVNKPIFVLNHGINENIFKYKKRLDLYNENNPDYPFTFGYCGEIGSRKGIYETILAFKKVLNKKRLGIKLLLRGNLDCSQYNRTGILNKIKELGLENFVEIIEKNEGQQDIVETMYKMHCFLAPSRADSFGMTILEALATGLPVITHEHIGVSELINDYIIPVKTKEVPIKDHPILLQGNGETWFEADVNDLSKKMLDVMENYEQYSEQARKGSAYVHEYFTWKKIMDNFTPTLKMLSANKRKKEICVYITSFNRKDYLQKTLQSIVEKKYIDEEYEYKICIFEQSTDRKIQDEVYTMVKNEFPEVNEIYLSNVNLGLRGAFNKAYHMNWFKNSEHILVTDQDNTFLRPFNIYAKILEKYHDKGCRVVTGYLSKEHGIDGIENIIYDQEFGINIEKKNSMRGGMIFVKTKDLLEMLPFELDSEYGKEWNCQPYLIGFDWNLSHWSPKSFAKQNLKDFVYCIPNSVTHEGFDSSWRSTDEKFINSEEVNQNIQYDIKNELNKNVVLQLTQK